MSVAAPFAPATVHQLKVVLRDVSLMVWQRLLVTSDTTIAHVHDIAQIAMRWEQHDLHQLPIHGKAYGTYRDMDGTKRFFAQLLAVVGHGPRQVTTHRHDAYPQAIRETLGL